MAFFPFAMPPMEAMQNSFRRAAQNAPLFMAMGMPMMAHSQAQAQCGRWQQPHFPNQDARASNDHDDENAFHIDLDVQHFSPDEISVKMVDGQIIIEGNHKAREFGRISSARHFVHHYSVPEGVKFEDITSTLSSDGVLTISAPKAQKNNETNEKIIPITPTGLPAKKPAAGNPSSSKSNDEVKE